MPLSGALQAHEPPLVHEAVRDLAAHHPDRLALAGGGVRLNYGQLESITGSFASGLARILVGPSQDRLIALALDRSPWAIVAMLGAWRAGFGVLPIDASLPPSRAQFMLDDAGAELLVVDAEARSAAPLSIPTVTIQELQSGSKEHHAHAAGRRDLAYVIYTSGSTGTPKGVMIEHRNVAHYAAALNSRLRVPPETSWAVVSSLATDLAYTGVFPPLTIGGSVHVLSRDEAIDPIVLERYVRDERIHAIKIAPTHMRALASAGHVPKPKLRLVFGGERLTQSLVRSIEAELPSSCTIHNHYGPTETTIGATMYRWRRSSSSDQAESVPIGRALGTTDCVVEGGDGRPLQPGDDGLLFIAGEGVGRGYLGKPELTAALFRPTGREHPFHRAYGTGDVVRVNESGDLVFLGRLDDQIKIRGHRVEIGEVETALETLRGVVGSAAALSLDGDAATIVAALVLEPGASVTLATVRTQLYPVLPEWMLPTSLAVVDALPQLASGKVDRAAVASLAQGGSQDITSLRAKTPRQTSSWQDLLTDVFREVLGDPSLTEDDDFFAAGGNSLHAVEAIGRIRALAGDDVPLAVVFLNPTARELAEAIAAPVETVA